MKNGFEYQSYINYRKNICGRDKELEMLDKIIKSPVSEKTKICYFYGDNGFGKSCLCNYTALMYRGEGIKNTSFIRIDTDNYVSDSHIIRNIYNTLITNTIFSFPRYEMFCYYLSEIMGISDYRINRTLRNYDELEATAEAVSVAANNPYVSAFKFVFSKLPNSFNGSTRNNQGLSHMFNNPYVDMNTDRIVAQLTMALTEDINSSLDKYNRVNFDHGLVITFDNFEKYTNLTDDSIISDFIKEIKWAKIFVFSNRKNQLGLSDSATEKFDFEKIHLGPLPVEVVKKFLTEKGTVPDEKTRYRMALSAHKIPAALPVVIKLQEQGRDISSAGADDEIYADLFNRYYKSLPEAEKVLLFRLSLYETWDIDIFLHSNLLNISGDSFRHLTEDNSLVEAHRESYKIVEVVQETLANTYKNNQSHIFTESHYHKFKYESARVDRLLSALGRNIVDVKDCITELEIFRIGAFRSAIYSCRTPQRFYEVSEWCVKTEQRLTGHKLFILKERLTGLYLQLLEENPQLAEYDISNNIFWGYRYQNIYDRTWASRYVKSSEEAIAMAQQALAGLIAEKGEDIAFKSSFMYMLGIVYTDGGEYEKAGEILHQRYDFEKNLLDRQKKNKLDVMARITNQLGCRYMDTDDFRKGEEFLELSLRYKRGRAGLATAYRNLAKLYFRKSQMLYINGLEGADRALAKARENFNKELANSDINPGANSNNEYFISKTAVLEMARIRLEEGFENNCGRLKDFMDKFTLCEKLLSERAYVDKKMQLAMWQNTAIIHALMGNVRAAKENFDRCEEEKYAAYHSAVESARAIEKKPAIIELAKNRRWFADNRSAMPTGEGRYNFLLQF